MNPEEQSGSGADEALRAVQGKCQTELVTLLFTDVVASMALKQQLGDRAGLQLIQRHHELLRRTLQQFAGAREINTAGDSFFLAFATPSLAVSFALLLQARLRQFNAGSPAVVYDRVGIHLGEVTLEGGEQARDLHGLSVDLCARVMSLARGGQILLTRAVFDSARQVLKGEDVEGLGELRWLNHGAYLLKGVDEPVEICEVGFRAERPTTPPPSTEKARRYVTPGEEPVLGWRPAIAQAVPNTKWVLEEKLGEGGFGEVWKAHHETLDEQRVFKFCFRADRVRSLKREVTLFRLLKERIGEHPHIVKLHDIYFDQPPFYLEEEYVAGKDLKTWCEARGGVGKVLLEVKLEVVAQAAEALQAAHDAGVIHRDVKPGNILVGTPKPEVRSPPVEVKLTDFGIGQVVSQEYLVGVTRAGFTQTLLGSTSSQTGTQLYMAPELLAGKPASIRSDIYSLGVVTFQLVVGDFTRPVAPDWEKEIEDPLLREELHLCFAGNPANRFAGAAEFAHHLRDLPRRRAELAEREAKRIAAEEAAQAMLVAQRKTRRGRATLLLAEQAAFCAEQPGRQRLPSLPEFLNILAFTRSRDWTREEGKLMRAASRLHAIRLGAIAVLVGILLGGRQLWTGWRVQHWVGAARAAWTLGGANWPQACRAVERAYEAAANHPDLEGLLLGMSQRGFLVIRTEPAGAEIRVEPDLAEGAKTGLKLTPRVLVPDAGEPWHAGERIPVAPGHYRVTIRAGNLVREFPVFVSQVLYDDTETGWHEGARVRPAEVFSWRPTGDRRIAQVRIAEELTIGPVFLAPIPPGYVYVPPGPHWCSADWDLKAQATLKGPPSNEWCEVSLVTRHALLSVAMTNGFFMGKEEVSAGDYARWFLATLPERRVWIVDSRFTHLLQQMRDVPFDVLKRYWKSRYASKGLDVEKCATTEALCRVVAELEVVLENRLGYDETLRRSLESQAATDPRQPVQDVNRFYALDYAWTHAAPKPEDFVHWLVAETNRLTVLLGRLQTLRAELSSREPLLPLTAVPGDILLPYFDHNFHEFTRRTLVQEYYDWLRYNLVFAAQLPPRAIVVWARTKGPELSGSQKTAAEEMAERIRRDPWLSLGEEYLEGADLLYAYAQEIQRYEWHARGQVELLPSDYLANALERGRQTNLERDHFARWLDLRVDGCKEQIGDRVGCLRRLGTLAADSVATGRIPWELRQEYGADLGWGLPSLAQWEKACRGVDARTYPWGDGHGFKNVAGACGGPVAVQGSTAEDDVSPYGVVHMAGNVSEWIQPPEGLKTAREEFRDFLKGGNWYHPEALAQAGSLMHVRLYHRGPCIGFRVVREILP